MGRLLGRTHPRIIHPSTHKQNAHPIKSSPIRSTHPKRATSMHLIVRAAMEADLPAMMELIQLKAEFDGWPNAFKATSDQIRQAFFSSPPRMQALLAESEGPAIGIASYYPTFSTLQARPGIWLDDLYVRDGYRSRGVGKAIMSALARIAKGTNCGRIEWTVALSNDRGIAFYERNGASIRHLSRCVRLGDAAIERLSTEAV